MFRSDRLRAGIFIPPHHPNDEDPTLAIHRDFELIELSPEPSWERVAYNKR